jgi:DNA replication protein DnaC
MMTPDEIWREQFIARYRLDRRPLDESLLHEDGTALAPLDGPAIDPVPVRYSGALAADQQVRDWMADLARRAIDERRVVVSVTTGPSRLLLGITGTGKTHEAYGAVRGMALLGVRSRWRFVTAPDLYALLRPRAAIDSQRVFLEYAGASLLVVDDLGTAKRSEWTDEVNFRLVNHRYEHVLPTLWTSNLLPAQLGNALGDRVASRLTEMTGGTDGRITLKGDDRRYPPTGAAA